MTLRERWRKSAGQKRRDKRANVQITTTVENGIITKVLIDGHDVSNKVCGLNYEHKAGEVPKLTLTFIPKKVTITSVGDVQAHDVDLGPLAPWD